MPPRRPGGKYRGVIKRFKGEATREEEQDEARAKALQKYVAEQQAKKEAALLMPEVSNTKADQEARLKIINMMLGGRRGNVRKFFNLWMQGMQVMKYEKTIRARDLAWRRSCGCHDNFCLCGAQESLSDIGFKMPFDVRQERMARAIATKARMAELARANLPPLVRRDKLEPLPTRQDSKDMFASSGFGSKSQPQLTALRRQTDLKPGKLEAFGWPCGCTTCVGTDKAKTTNGMRLRPGFFSGEETEVAIHRKTGRRIMLDNTFMRTCFADVTKQCKFRDLALPSKRDDTTPRSASSTTARSDSSEASGEELPGDVI